MFHDYNQIFNFQFIVSSLNALHVFYYVRKGRGRKKRTEMNCKINLIERIKSTKRKKILFTLSVKLQLYNLQRSAWRYLFEMYYRHTSFLCLHPWFLKRPRGLFLTPRGLFLIRGLGLRTTDLIKDQRIFFSHNDY